MSSRSGGTRRADALRPLRPSVFRDLPGITAAFSPRSGGESRGSWASLNLGEGIGDDPHHVERNRRRFFLALGLDPHRVALARQVHGATVRTAEGPGLYPDCDGLVTTQPGLTLALGAADCAIVLLADAQAGVVGGAHAGWRGFLAGIVPATVHRMVELGAGAEALRAYVSPCISVDRFEVGEEVASRFPPDLVLRQTEGARPHVDLKEGIRRQLSALGLHRLHILIDPACTASDPEQFFSHRASNGLTGRHLGAICFGDVVRDGNI